MKNNKKNIIVIAAALMSIVVIVGIIFIAPQHVTIPPTSLASTPDFEETIDPEIALNDELEESTELEDDVEEIDEELVEQTSQEKWEGIYNNIVSRIESENIVQRHVRQEALDEFTVDRAILLKAINEDPALLSVVIDEFLANPNSTIGTELGTVLAATGAAEVQVAALDLGLDSFSDRDARLASLTLLSRMDQIDGQTRDRLLDSYSGEPDTEVLEYSLIALTESPGTAEDFARVQSTLNEVAAHENEHVRRHSLYQIAEWGTSNEDLAPLRTAAVNDSDINVRMRAIMSIAESGINSAENQQALWNFANNYDEIPVARLRILESLNKYPLSAEQQAQHESLTATLKQQQAR